MIVLIYMISDAVVRKVALLRQLPLTSDAMSVQPNKQSQKVKDQQKARLKELLALPGNRHCADCNEKGTNFY
jgi:hypothetical protein